MAQLQKQKKLYLIDGSGLIFRAYYAMPSLTRRDGTPIGAVLGFTNMLSKLLTEMRAHKMVIVFDSKRKTFRNAIYPEYKENREETPKDLILQFPIIRHACSAFQVPMIEQAGYEADDLIATYARLAEAQGYQVVIVSSDKDLMQVVSGQITMFDHMKSKTIGIPQVIEKFGVSPDQVVDVQALAGDSVDNVPGVPGIGPKIAAALIQEFGDLETLLDNAHTIKQPKRRESLCAYAEQARLSKKLVLLQDEVPVSADISDFEVPDMDNVRVCNFLQEQGFNRLIAKFDTQDGVADETFIVGNVVPEYTCVTDSETLASWCTEIQRVGFVAIDAETNSLDAMSAELVGISLSTAPGKACYIPMGHNYSPQLGESPLRQLSQEVVFEALGPILSAQDILKIGQNVKYDILVLKQTGIDVSPVSDTMLLSYLTSGGLHRLNELAQRYFDHTMIKFADIVSKKTGAATFAQVPVAQATAYAAEGADFTLRLHLLLNKSLVERSAVGVYERIERPLIPILVDMEQRGVRVDPSCLQTLSHSFSCELETLKEQIFQVAGQEFNIASPKQMGVILFELLGLPGGKKTKTGAYRTGIDILERLAHAGHEIASLILVWRQFSKLKSTYTDALLKQVNPTTGRVHTSYSMAITSTGRLSSSDPNLQNIPIRTQKGRKIRAAFVAQPGSKLMSFDYSQIELRLLAHVAKIQPLIDAFKDGIDIHALTAAQVFGVDVSYVTPELRRRAKAINFGIIYGMSPFGLAKQLNIPQREASNYMTAYALQYPGIQPYMEDMKYFARHNGYVSTPFGRRCYVPMIFSKNPTQQAFAERQAINAPLQGGAADIIKMAMIDVMQVLKENGQWATAMLLQVHDELIFEAEESVVDHVTGIIKAAMENVVTLDVPLMVDVGVGDNWSEAH